MKTSLRLNRKARSTGLQTLAVCLGAGALWFALSGKAGVDQIALYLFFALFALGMDLLWGRTGVMSFGHAVWFGLGAYTYAWVAKGSIHGSAVRMVNEWLPAASLVSILVAVLVPMLGAALFGWLIFPSGIKGPYFAVVTMALSFLMASLALAVPTVFGGWTGIGFVPPVSIGGVVLVGDYHAGTSFVVATALCVGVAYSCRRLSLSRFGLRADGIRDNEDRLEYIGVDIPRVKLIFYIISAGISGLAGSLYAAQSGYVSPELLGTALSTEVAIWVAVGGRGTLVGAVLGALLVRGVGNLLGSAALNYWQIILGALFIVVVLFARAGVVGFIYRIWDNAGARKRDGGAAIPPNMERAQDAP